MGSMQLQNLLAPSPPQPPPLEEYHYNEWLRLIRKQTTKRATIIKFLINLIIYTGETASLVFTLITGLIIPDDQHESYAAFGLYAFTCCVTVGVSYCNQTRCSNTKPEPLKTLLLNLAFITKPLRYFKLFSVRQSRYRVIKREEENIRTGCFITERSIQSLSQIAESQLEDNKIDLYECFFQHIPMTLLQTYFLFQTHQRFQLCNLKDLSRLIAIITPLIHAAKAASTYESTKIDFEQTLHFLEYYKSKGDHPMVVYVNDILSLSGLFNFVCHMSTILHRFYTATYFIVVSPFLTITYLSSVFILNTLMLQIYPALLDIHQNPPYGVSSFPSYAADRLVNIFSNVGTRFNKYSDNPVWRYRVPLVLIQIIHFVVPLSIVYSTQSFYVNSAPIETIKQSTNLNDTLDSCPELHSIYHKNQFFTKIGDFLFSSYKSVDDRLQTYSDVFQFFHLLWLLFYAQLLATTVYAYSDLMKRRRKSVDEPYFLSTYPILTGYAFYEVLFTKVLNLDGYDRTMSIRKLMLATVLKEQEFYKAISVLGVFKRRTFTNNQVENLTKLAISRISTPNDQLDMKINSCVHSGHRFLNEFVKIRDILYCEGNDEEERIMDKKLFLGFFAYFDRKICAMSSDRVKRVFGIVGVRIEKGGDGLGERGRGF